MLKARFEDQYADFESTTATFAELVVKRMRRLGWGSVDFRDSTMLSESTYSLLVNNADKCWAFLTVVAICVGLGVGKQDADRLLAAAGHSFGVSRKHQAYAFLFTESSLAGRSIVECNAFLEVMGVPVLC
jgi:hypothetical protein